MAKKFFVAKREVSKEGFRYRGLQTTRLENLTDAVFGFSITLLVISSQVPATYVELQASMYSFIGFIFCTILLLGLWNNHNNFFLHYGLQDTPTKVLNALFLFVLLFYVYPLKYLFSHLGTEIYVGIKHQMGDRSEALQHALANLLEARLTEPEWKDLMIRFGFGLFFIYLIIMLMHINAFKRAPELDLNPNEKFITQTFVREYFILMLVTVLSMMVVVIFGGEAAKYSGMVYLLTPILIPIYKKYRRRKRAKLGLDQ